MSYGYSIKVVELNKKADRKSLGVILGRECIKRNIPVSEVASMLGVSRQTIYNWFTGETYPQPQVADLISEFLTTLRH